jgi:hypothetical protein
MGIDTNRSFYPMNELAADCFRRCEQRAGEKTELADEMGDQRLRRWRIILDCVPCPVELKAVLTDPKTPEQKVTG